MKQIKIGSLFDGIGAFPYAANLFGIKTVWASEILSSAISVTRRHFPEMNHVGDITKLNGALLTPVDVIVFGSPCQDLSQAAGGNRKGLDGERSGLFMEAIRIINEMRKATNGKYPRYACWENVPGCFSSNARRDYKKALEAFTESSIPMPGSGRWTTAGMVRSDRVNLAWCVYNAQHFGLAQRRKRVFLIADFAKGRPEEILLVPKSLYWYPPQSFGERQGITAAAEIGSCSTEQKSYGICSLNSNSMKSSNPHSGVYEADTSRTLDLNCGNPSCNQGGMAVVAFNGGASPQAGSIAYSKKVSPTLKSASSGLRTPCVCEPIAILNDQGGDSLNVEKDERSPTLRCSTHGNLPIVCASANIAEVHPKITGTLCASAAGLSRPGGMGSESDLAVAYATFSRRRSDIFQDDNIASTQTARQHKDATDLCVSYCLQGNMIGRKDKNGPAGCGINENISYTLNASDCPAVAVDCRNFKENNEVSGTLLAKATEGYSLNYQNPVRKGYIVRRLTPIECERLMGFPDGWTEFGHDGKIISDSRRYSMLGNSIATPCAAYIIQGILEQYAKEEH